eukprot:g4567.t1 g4567   contig15:1304446-1306118(+)
MPPAPTPSRRRRQNSLQKKQSIFVAVILFMCLFGILMNRPSRLSSRRNLSLADVQKARYLHDSHSTLLPWAQFNLKGVHETPDDNEVALFWHIPKSGGTTAKRLYECMGQTLANRMGGMARFGHHEDTEIEIFQPFKAHPNMKMVNVDVTNTNGIMRAKEMGLIASGKVDMIFTSEINTAADHLFDRKNKGRIFAFFRHPVDRVVSKFYYLQTATWENTYRPEWKDLSVTEWATEHNSDENFMVKKILGKKLNDKVGLGDLIVAKEIVKNRFFVGLMNDMAESIRRFNIVLGVDTETNEKNKQCMRDFFGDPEDEEASTSETVEEQKDGKEAKKGATDNKNSNAHPKVLEGSPEYELLAERNSLDVILYNYILLLNDQQKHIVDGYSEDAPVSVKNERKLTRSDEKAVAEEAEDDENPKREQALRQSH